MNAALFSLFGGQADTKLYVEDVFSTYLYTGNGSTQTINNGIDLAGEGGMVWTKCRNGDLGNRLQDTARGTGKELITDATSAETTTTAPSIVSFNSGGYTLGSVGNLDGDYNSTFNYASWTFRRAQKFFDVVEISHTNGTPTNIDLSSLGTIGQVIAKITNISGDWIVWHRSLTTGNNMRLNTTAAQTTTNAWLSVTGTTAILSASAPTGTYIVYAWAHDDSADGIIKCGSFTTDGSGNATVDLGWEPQLVITKATSATGDWRICDTARGFTEPGTGGDAVLFPNTSVTEVIGSVGGPSASGFTWIGAAGAANTTFAFTAIRRGPMRVPTDATKVYKPSADSGVIATGFPVDLHISSTRAGSTPNHRFHDRLRGGTKELTSTTTAAETTVSDLLFDSNNGLRFSFPAGQGNHLFRRATGFFDIVCYTGTGVARTVAHNLGVPPELMIVKVRTSADDWQVYSAALGTSQKILFNAPNGQLAAGAIWNSTSPTGSVFSVGTGTLINGVSNTYVAYLFATCPGVSKVGSYVGNGTTQNIDCGFATGARFVLIKRTDSAGDWYIWDTARGIVAANDPHLSLNTTAAEVTTDDSLDPYAPGFAVNQVAATNINVNGGSYIFLAIA